MTEPDLGRCAIGRARAFQARVVGPLSLLVALVLGCRAEVAAPPSAAALLVSTAAVTERALPRQVVASGTILPWQELQVGAESGGYAVVELFADEGDAVRAGEPLARLNDRVLRAQLAQQEATVTEARATLSEAEANLARAEEMRRRDATSAQALDARRAAAATARARLAVAEAALSETGARLSQTRILAPADGTVSTRSVELGQVVQPGQELFRIVRDGRLELHAEVPEVELARIAEGQAASVLAEGVGTVEATVRRVAPTVDSRSRLGIVHLSLPPAEGLRPGMFARAQIDLGEVSALVVPQKAVVFREDRAGAFVVEPDGLARFRPVETGGRSGDAVEIRSGLVAGDRVAIEGAGFLEDGDRVRVVEEPGLGTKELSQRDAGVGS